MEMATAMDTETDSKPTAATRLDMGIDSNLMTGTTADDNGTTAHRRNKETEK